VVVVAATLWMLISLVLLAPGLGLPRVLERAAGWLLVAEFLALLVAGYGSEGCTERPCGTLAELARTIAHHDIPALTAGLLVLSALHPLFVRRAARLRRLGDGRVPSAGHPPPRA